MWDGLLMLILLCIVMGAASFLAGALPLSFSLSSRQLRLITALGTGVLVGTSLIVIIPEGVETLYSASASGSGHGHGERSLLSHRIRRAEVGALGGYSSSGAIEHGDVWRRDARPAAVEFGSAPADTNVGVGFVTGPDDGGYNTGEEGVTQAAPPTTDSSASSEAASGLAAEPTDALPNPETNQHAREPHAWVGVSLILGFVLMYLIDTLPRHATTRAQPQRFAVSLNQFSFNRQQHTASNPYSSAPSEEEEEEEDPHPEEENTSPQTSRPSSTTVGLVIHALADGIALGASSSSSSSTAGKEGGSRSRLTLIIFLALMLHKAPAAFGLTSVLLKQGLTKRMARAHLIVFSLAAPLGALLTWSAAHLLGYSSTMLGESDDGGGAEFATGVLLLFSGGTFLYVAVHTMQESSGGGHAHAHGGVVMGNGYAGVPGHDVYDAPRVGATAAAKRGEGGPPALVDTLVTVGGMLLPLLTQWGHAH